MNVSKKVLLSICIICSLFFMAMPVFAEQEVGVMLSMIGGNQTFARYALISDSVYGIPYFSTGNAKGLYVNFETTSDGNRGYIYDRGVRQTVWADDKWTLSNEICPNYTYGGISSCLSNDVIYEMASRLISETPNQDKNSVYGEIVGGHNGWDGKNLETTCKSSGSCGKLASYTIKIEPLYVEDTGSKDSSGRTEVKYYTKDNSGWIPITLSEHIAKPASGYVYAGIQAIRVSLVKTADGSNKIYNSFNIFAEGSTIYGIPYFHHNDNDDGFAESGYDTYGIRNVNVDNGRGGVVGSIVSNANANNGYSTDIRSYNPTFNSGENNVIVSLHFTNKDGNLNAPYEGNNIATTFNKEELTNSLVVTSGGKKRALDPFYMLLFNLMISMPSSGVPTNPVTYVDSREVRQYTSLRDHLKTNGGNVFGSSGEAFADYSIIIEPIYAWRSENPTEKNHHKVVYATGRASEALVAQGGYTGVKSDEAIKFSNGDSYIQYKLSEFITPAKTATTINRVVNPACQGNDKKHYTMWYMFDDIIDLENVSPDGEWYTTDVSDVVNFKNEEFLTEFRNTYNITSKELNFIPYYQGGFGAIRPISGNDLEGMFYETLPDVVNKGVGDKKFYSFITSDNNYKKTLGWTDKFAITSSQRYLINQNGVQKYDRKKVKFDEVETRGLEFFNGYRAIVPSYAWQYKDYNKTGSRTCSEQGPYTDVPITDGGWINSPDKAFYIWNTQFYAVNPASDNGLYGIKVGTNEKTDNDFEIKTVSRFLKRVDTTNNPVGRSTWPTLMSDNTWWTPSFNDTSYKDFKNFNYAASASHGGQKVDIRNDCWYDNLEQLPDGYESSYNNNYNDYHKARTTDYTSWTQVVKGHEKNYFLVPVIYEVDFCLDTEKEPEKCEDTVEQATCDDSRTEVHAIYHESDDIANCAADPNANSGFTMLKTGYGTVSCKEDLDFYLPHKKEAVAGQYFNLNAYGTKSPRIEAERTCATSSINYDSFDKALTSIESSMPEAYEKYKGAYDVYSNLAVTKSTAKTSCSYRCNCKDVESKVWDAKQKKYVTKTKEVCSTCTEEYNEESWSIAETTSSNGKYTYPGSSGTYVKDLPDNCSGIEHGTSPSSALESAKNDVKKDANTNKTTYDNLLKGYTNTINEYIKMFSWALPVDKTQINLNTSSLSNSSTFAVIKSYGGDIEKYKYSFKPEVTFDYKDADGKVFSVPYTYPKKDVNPSSNMTYWGQGVSAGSSYQPPSYINNPNYNAEDYKPQTVERKLTDCGVGNKDTCQKDNQTITFYKNSAIKRVENIDHEYTLPDLVTSIPSGTVYKKGDQTDGHSTIALEKNVVPVNINTTAGTKLYSMTISKYKDKIRSDVYRSNRNDDWGDDKDGKLKDANGTEVGINGSRIVKNQVFNGYAHVNNSEGLTVYNHSYVCTYDVVNDIYLPKEKKFGFFYRVVDTYNINPLGRNLGYNWTTSGAEQVKTSGKDNIKSDALDITHLTEDHDRFVYTLSPVDMQQIRSYNKGTNYADWNLQCSDYANGGYQCRSNFLNCLAGGSAIPGQKSCSQIIGNNRTNYEFNGKTIYSDSELDANRAKLKRKQSEIDKKDGIKTNGG